MPPTPTPLSDLFDLVVQGEAHASHPGKHPGGEWDYWFALPRRKRKRLIGARFVRSGALMPDQLQDLIRRNHPNLDPGEDPLEWFFRMAPKVIDERRYARNRDRHAAVAARTGHSTYHAHRDAWCRGQGARSLWYYRKAKGW